MFGLHEDEWRDLVLSVNVRKKDRRLSPFQVAGLLMKALEQTDIATLAKALGSDDKTTLQKIARLAKLPDQYACLVDWGSRRGYLSMSTAAELLRLESLETVLEAFKAAIEASLTKDEARQVIQISQRSHRPILECVQQALLTRPKITRHELIIGSVVSRKARQIVVKLGAETVTKKLRLALARHYPTIVAESVRVSEQRFSLMFTAADAASFRQFLGGASVENTVTRHVESFDSSTEAQL
jgi:hypothetical protein